MNNSSVSSPIDMPSQRIRPIALCIFWHQGRILVSEMHDPARQQSVWRPVGGGIEFGETSAQAVVREVREELGAEVRNLRLIATLENIFSHLGKPGHEIVQIYDGEFVDRTLYERASLSGVENCGGSFQASWRALERFSPESPLVPQGPLQILQPKVAGFAVEG